MKYFILGAFASAIFLYGIALIYGITGTTNLVEISRVMFDGLAAVGTSDVGAAQAAAANSGFVDFVGLNANGVVVFKLTAIPAIGLIMILVAFAFKVAAVPFHAWTPDVYMGAPTAAVAFMATGVKAAAFAGLIRVFAVGFFDQAARISDTGWLNALFWLALFSMVVGNLVALVQKDVKRMLAYSSISHAGFMLVGVASAAYAPEHFHSMDAVVFYAFSYTFGTAGAFGVLAYLGKRGEECTTYDDLSGIAKKFPGAALAMTIFMLSAAGIPPTAGFVAKFFVLRSAVQTGQELFIILAVVGVLASVAGVYYYLKVVLSMYMKAPRREVRSVGGFEIKAALTICATATVFLGIFPGALMNMATQGIHRTMGLPLEVSSVLKGETLEAGLAGEQHERAEAPAVDLGARLGGLPPTIGKTAVAPLRPLVSPAAGLRGVPNP
jgi:NADH-quinone oxidoreductase subunit N